MKLLGELLCCEFDFADIEGSDSRDLEAGSDLSGKPALRATEDDVEEFGVSWDGSDVLPGGLHCGDIDRNEGRGQSPATVRCITSPVMLFLPPKVICCCCDLRRQV